MSRVIRDSTVFVVRALKSRRCGHSTPWVSIYSRGLRAGSELSITSLKGQAVTPMTAVTNGEPQRNRSRPVRSGVLLSLLVLVAVFTCAGSAFADSASISVTNTVGGSDPASSVPRVFTVSGVAAVPERIYVKYRAPGGAECAPSAESDSGKTIYGFAYDNSVNGEFHLSSVVEWGSPGPEMFCIWLAQGESSAASPITQTITFRAPNGTITATVNPITPRTGQPATITVTGSSEAPARVYATIRSAGGAGCAPTYEADSGQSLIDGQGVNGSFSLQATTTQAQAGTYLICLWLASSENATPAIAGPQPETFTVANPPPPPPPPPPAPSAECLRDRGGVAHGELLIRRYEGKLRAHHLSRRTRRTDEHELAAARISAGKYEGLRRHQCPAGK
jgi:hypothetical protein